MGVTWYVQQCVALTFLNISVDICELRLPTNTSSAVSAMCSMCATDACCRVVNLAALNVLGVIARRHRNA
ncbi:Hypothetical predicted protein, partial [Olea europaea subsp. europaea]